MSHLNASKPSRAVHFGRNCFHKVSTAGRASQNSANPSGKTHLAAKTGSFWTTAWELLWYKQRRFIKWRVVLAKFAPEGKRSISKTTKRHPPRSPQRETAEESATRRDRGREQAAREANKRRARCTTERIQPWQPPHLLLRTRPPRSSVIRKGTQLQLARNRHRHLGVEQHVRVFDFGV
jgi:hypothetical protein